MRLKTSFSPDGSQRNIYYIFDSEFCSEALEKSTHEMLKFAKKERIKGSGPSKVNKKEVPLVSPGQAD